MLGLPTLVVALDIGVLFLALPHLSADLGASDVEQLWIMDIYGFLMAGCLITMGNLGDRIGRRRLLLIGVTCFGVLSVAAAYSTSPEMLIVSRALMGIAAATLMPSTLALISNMFRDEDQRRIAIAAWMSCMMVGSALGPVVGGLLLDLFWWGAVFLLGVPVALLLVVAGPVLLPEYRNPNPGRLDLTSVILSLATTLPIIYGVKEVATGHLGSALVPVGAIVVGIVFGVVLVRRQLRLPDPLLDLRLFRNRAFSATLVSQLVAAGIMAGTFLLVSQYVQTVMGLSPAEAGLWLLPLGLSIAVGSQLSQLLVRWMSHKAAIAGGLALSALGFLPITQVTPAGGLLLAVIGGAVLHLGTGPLFALGANLVVGSVPPERAGSAASLSETSNIFGSTLGLAVLGTLGAAVYRSGMSDVTVPGVSPEAADAARGTISGAVVTAQNMADATSLLRAAREAYTTGVHVAAIAGAVAFLALAALVLRAFTHQRRRPTAATVETVGTA
ncbi:MFS transporter [Amycolatopsis arida]|uniref:MFS transporter n=1 Tax=Amycolatopsis arida TaxID=587909 RepID=UPI001FBA75C1|nr:MFS transporter [Amycolatopsis arida]